MALTLDHVEVRILGCLIEKDITTPEYYPLTLNALVNACNQKSNRDPVVSWDEDVVAEGIDTLHDKKLVARLTGGSNRVPKYSHRLQETLNLGRREVAILCELMLRGPQTAGELRDRAGRMHRFSDTDEVLSSLNRLQEFPGGELVTQLPRQAGQKEARFAHLLSGEPDIPAAVEEVSPRAGGSGLEARVAALENEVREMRELLARMRTELGID
jgi:uncharacterized protein YceH (UPF0502 family)